MSSDFFKINVLTFDLSLCYARPRPFILYMTRKTPINKAYHTKAGEFLQVATMRLRMFTAALTVPVLKITGYRFSKNFRHGVTYRHRAVYAMVDTVHANLWAGMQPDPEVIKFLED